MKKTAILIVLYDKEICDSTTVESLTKLELEGVRIIIHNNGPHIINLTKQQDYIFKNKGADVILVNSIENKPLSVIYNDFINANLDCEIFSIFDDDSRISIDYISIIKNHSFEIELPKIMSRVDHKIYYPTVDKIVFSEDGEIIASDVFSIGSGLTITRGVIDKFNNHKMNLFDEHYALYGVDFSFFRRLKKLQKKWGGI
ncbi:TPA: glycosyltransferase family 2 protein [Raoultella planticola]